MSYRIAQPDARILIVDDDDIMRGLYEVVLSQAGYGTNSAADGEEALAMLAASDFDLVLTDCNMPRLDGLELIRALRDSGSRIPIMMISGSLANGGSLPSDLAGEVAVALPKPVRSLELLVAVARALGADSVCPDDHLRHQRSTNDEYSSS